KSFYKKNFSDFSIVHVATHAFSDSIYTDNVGIVFDADKTDSLNNGFLSLSEIASLNANGIKMVFLSACNTGFGNLTYGEGPNSLAYSFLYAGAKSVVMTQWKIPDETTPDIVIEFYRNLKKGQRKSEALRNAKLTYLDNQEDPLKRHPYYWAGFVLIGDDSPIVFTSERKYDRLIFWMISIVTLLIMIQLVRRKGWIKQLK
ncbi:MAG: CHAT domain-containing protein, partial [Bacteroidota bacterium]